MNTNQNIDNECVICLEKLFKDDFLPCGHRLHLSCVKKHFKPECPICRYPLNIKVTGILPKDDDNLSIDLINRIQEEDRIEQMQNEITERLFDIIYQINQNRIY